MTRKYTAADFANARFAQHPETDALAVHRADPRFTESEWTALDEDGFTARINTEVMANCGWVPVPTKPTITESEYQGKVEGHSIGFADGYFCALRDTGIEIIPDQEPTNTEKLREILNEVWTPTQDAQTFAEWLNDHGVIVKED